MLTAIVILASLTLGQTSAERATIAEKPSQRQMIRSPFYTPLPGHEAILWSIHVDNDEYTGTAAAITERAFDRFWKHMRDIDKGLAPEKLPPAILLSQSSPYKDIFIVKGGTKVRVLDAPKVPFGEAEYSTSRVKVLEMDGDGEGRVSFVPMSCVVHLISNPIYRPRYKKELASLKGGPVPTLRSIQENYKPKVGDISTLYAWTSDIGPRQILAANSRSAYAQLFECIDKNDLSGLDRLYDDKDVVRLPSETRVRVVDLPPAIPGFEAPPARIVVLKDGENDGDEEWFVPAIAVNRFASKPKAKP
jgi:hypothetical protein